MPSLSRTARPTALGWVYVLGVAALAAYGFTTESTVAILLAAAAALPLSVVALPAYYVVYGLLAQLPGANPSSSTSNETCSAEGVCQGWSTGDPAAWFETTTTMLGILILASAALLNVVMLRRLVALYRGGRAHGSERPSLTAETGA